MEDSNEKTYNMVWKNPFVAQWVAPNEKRMVQMDNAIVNEYTKLLERKAELQKELSVLPQGYISKKNINGRTYYYLQNRVSGKMTGIYLKKNEMDRISEQIRLRKQYEAELPKVNSRLSELEQAARLIGHGLDRRLLLQKLGVGMDTLSAEQKGCCISFADAMNAIEGVPASEQTSQELADWQGGRTSYLSVFEATLRRYGFGTEVQP